MFIDKATLQVKAGNGGDGIVSWRKERYIDRGGPNGGDGGHGGDVIFLANRQLNSLHMFRKRQLLEATHGQPGAKQNMHGRNGKDLIVELPLGTKVFLDEELLADLVHDGQKTVVAYGGRGGFGNAHFKSSRRRAPKIAEKGEQGEHYDLRLEMSMIADVGLIGLPNAGKSTLLSVVSNARPDIADYPFTTLSPNLGVADINSGSLLIADIPGLIEGASKGKGLGDEFLRHVERTAVLVHLVDAYSDDVERDYKTIMEELRSYRIDLTTKPMLVVLSKIDGLDDDIVADQLKQLKKVAGASTVAISSLTKKGLTPLLRKISTLVTKQRELEREEQEAEAKPEDAANYFTLPDRDAWTVEKKGAVFHVRGRKIERFAERTDFDNEFGIRRLRDIMRKMGIVHALKRKGIERGDRVLFGRTGEWEIEY